MPRTVPTTSAPPVQRVLTAVFTTLALILVACAAPTTPPPSGGEGPQFLINSPQDGGLTAGTFFFSAQPLDASSVARVDFEVDGVAVGSDSDGSDGFRVAVAARDYGAGPLVLEAVVTGTNGRSRTRSVTVENVPAPPSSDTVGADGAVLGTATGSTLVIRPGDAMGASVAFTEQTQAQVKTATGVDYEALGVTFLGAQEIDSDLVLEQPAMVSSADFGAFVQPGEAIVNYRVLPDVDGDGVGELVVVNTASLAGDDVISDPVPALQLGPDVIIASSEGAILTTLQSGVGGPPGTIFTLEGTGFNPFSVLGNVASFTAGATSVEVPVSVELNPENDGATQLLTTHIPALPAGPATLVLRNASTDFRTEPIDIDVQQPPPLSEPAIDIIDAFLAQTATRLQDTPLSSGEGDNLAAVLNELRTVYALLDADTTPEIDQLVIDTALMIENSGRLENSFEIELGAIGRPQQECVPQDEIDDLRNDAKWARRLNLALCGLLGTGIKGLPAELLTVVKLGCSLGFNDAWDDIDDAINDLPPCDDEPAPPDPPAADCPPAGAPAPTSSGPPPPTVTGMGGAPAAGGSGCGAANDGAGGAGGSNIATQQDGAGPIIVKIFTGGGVLPFTGVVDAGGYFFIPILPQDEPFTAVATQIDTNEVRSFEGIGPPVGESVYMVFDFLSDDNTLPTLPIDDNTSGVLELGGTDLYTFAGTAGQLITIGTQGAPDFVDNYDVDLVGPNATTDLAPFLGNGRFYSETGVIALPDSGLYTLSVVSDSSTGGGSGIYHVGLSEIDQPTPIDIGSSPATTVGEQTVYGNRHLFSFDAVAGDLHRFSLTLPAGSEFNARLNLRGPDSDPFYEGDGLLTPTVSVTRSSGISVSDPFVVPATGSYVIEIERGNSSDTVEISLGAWEFAVHTPDPPTAITIGDTVMGGVGVPGEIDLYTFSGGAGQSIDVSTANVDTEVQQVNWSLTAPDGTVLFDEPLFMDLDPVVLPEAGTYTLLVGSDSDDGSGAYEFTLANLP